MYALQMEQDSEKAKVRDFYLYPSIENIRAHYKTRSQESNAFNAECMPGT